MIQFDSEALSFEDGVMFGHAVIGDNFVKAGITLDAFERLIVQAGHDPDRDFGRIMVKDIMALLTPTIEALLANKYARAGLIDDALIIDLSDLVPH